MNQNAQTVVELMLLLAISMLALTIIYSFYSSQLELSNVSKEASVAKSSINKLVNSANALSLAGAGSTERVLIEVPADANVFDSNISGNKIYFRLSNGTEVSGIADVNIVGEFKKSDGKFVVNGYYVNLYFDGQKVILSYDDFELNTNGIFVSAKQGTSVQKVFTIRNNSSRNAIFWLENNFSYPNFAVLSIDSSDTYFTLSPNETRVIDFNIALSSFSSGNYAGEIIVTGQINDGISDTNITKKVIVSAESFLSMEPVMIFPKSTSFSAVNGTSTVKSFSLCNSTNSNVSLSWSRNSNPDANMLNWFNWPILNTDGVAINSVASGDCAYFDLNFTVPLSAVSNVYDANITITYGDGNTSSAYFFINLTRPLELYSLFFSTSNGTLPANYFLSNYTTQVTDSNYFVATGELDWNRLNDYSVNGVSWDLNLKAYYKFNSKNGTTIFDSAKENNGDLSSATSFTNGGLWDSNVLSLNGSDQYVYVGNVSDLDFALDSNFSVSGWIMPKESFPVWGTVFQKSNAIAALPSYGVYCAGASSCNFKVRDASNMLECTFSPKVSSWNHFVCTKYSSDKDYCKCYLDGVLSTSSSSATKINSSNSEPFYIGTGQNYFSGLIDELKIYNRTLSDSEVLSDYNSFLNAKFVDGNIVDAIATVDWNLIKINFDTNYNFGKEISSEEKFVDGLVGLWHLNDKNSSGYVLNSVSGVRDGQLNGNADINSTGLWDTNSCNFDGAMDSILIPHSLSMDAFTISTWLFPNNNTNDEGYGQTYFSSSVPHGTGTNYEIWLLLSSGTNVKVYAYQTDPSASFSTSTGLVKIGQWNHVVVSAIKGGALNVYVNGALAGSGTAGSYAWDSTQFIIGDLRKDRGIDFNGVIEEVAIWDRMLSASEITDLYRKGVSRLDLNVYSCSDSTCTTKTGSQYISDANNSIWMDLNSSILNSRYLGFDAYFKKARGFEDYDAKTFWVGSYLKDFNVSLIK